MWKRHIEYDFNNAWALLVLPKTKYVEYSLNDIPRASLSTTASDREDWMLEGNRVQDEEPRDDYLTHQRTIK